MSFFSDLLGAAVGVPLLGPTVAAAGDLIGADMQSDAIRDTNAANIRSAELINANNLAFQERMFDRSAGLQQEFARHGLRWRVEDAKAAGLHPLLAAGGSASFSSPVITGSSAQPVIQPDTAKGEALARMGQNVMRAIDAVMTPEERQLHDTKLALMMSEIGANDARAAAYRSEAARTDANRVVNPGLPQSRTIVAPAGNFRTSATTPAQVVQDEYGDIAENIYGLTRGINDVGMNFLDAVRRQNPWWYRAFDPEQVYSGRGSPRPIQRTPSGRIYR